jgi:hypothetical protein
MARKGKSLYMAFASAFAVSAMCLLFGIQDVKADVGAGQSLSDALKRIEALESRAGGGNVTTGARGIKIGVQIRTRFEQQKQFLIGSGNTITNPGGVRTSTSAANSTKGAGDSHVGVRESNEFVVQRVRLSFDADVNKNVRAFVMIDDNRTFGSEQSTTGLNDAVDMREGYAELRNLGDISPFLENVTVRAGRWQMFYGGHRLIGHLNWTNAGRAWDGARVRWDNKKGSWVDFFATNVSEDSTGAVSGDAPSRAANRDELFWGLYSHFKNPFGLLEGTVAEPYFLIRDRSTSDRKDTATLAGEERYTAGVRLVGKKIPSLPGVDFVFDQAWQFGHTETVTAGDVAASNPIQAFAGSWGVGYTFSNVAWSPRIGYQYAFASGDDRPGGGSSKTFSQLYPTGHARMGYIDFHAWQNIRAHEIEFSVKPSKKLLLKADLWFFEADEEADSWYGVAGGANRPGADRFVHTEGQTGNVDDEYGQELDITVKYKLFKNFGVVAGYTHYFTGDFMEDTNNGMDRDSDWAYLMTSLKF